MARYPQAILISCESPWDENEQLLEDVFRRQVRMVYDAGFRHPYIFGTAGEGYAVDTARFRQIVSIFAEETRQEDVYPQVGVIGLSTATVIERINIAREYGFKTFQISLPSWGMLNDEEILKFFVDVCGAFPDCQFLHYNLPRTKRMLTGADYRRIIDVVPNLVATKNTGGGEERAIDLLTNAPELQHFLGENNFAYGILLGECSLLSSSGPMATKQAQAYFEAGLRRDRDEIFRWQKWFDGLLHDVLGPLLTQERMDGAYDKLIVRLGGLEEMPMRLLSPYGTFTEEEYQQAKQVYDAQYRDRGI
jgi:dihydrodipicolinate synthase/N-acetylneuraminate lyase